MNVAHSSCKLTAIIGRPFVKRFTLCYRIIVCPVCLSVSLVYCGQIVGWINMKVGMKVGLGPGDIVLDGDPAPPPQKRHSPQFSADVCCDKTAGWIKRPLGSEIKSNQIKSNSLFFVWQQYAGLTQE